MPRGRVLLVLAIAAALFVGPARATVNHYFGWNFLSYWGPDDRCLSVFPGGSNRLACSGWNYWDRTRVYKDSGEWIRAGFWRPDEPYMAYAWFYGKHMSPPIVVTRFDVVDDLGRIAPPYNASTCAWDTGDASYVWCEAIIF